MKKHMLFPTPNQNRKLNKRNLEKQVVLINSCCSDQWQSTERLMNNRCLFHIAGRLEAQDQGVRVVRFWWVPSRLQLADVSWCSHRKVCGVPLKAPIPLLGTHDLALPKDPVLNTIRLVLEISIYVLWNLKIPLFYQDEQSICHLCGLGWSYSDRSSASSYSWHSSIYRKVLSELQVLIHKWRNSNTDLDSRGDC